MVSFKGQINNNKVVLQWEVDENETIYQFEVEKSTDGKNFALAALVFSTDKTANDNYMFFEKAGAEKATYRIKMIDKNGKASYSSVLTLTQ